MTSIVNMTKADKLKLAGFAIALLSLLPKLVSTMTDFGGAELYSLIEPFSSIGIVFAVVLVLWGIQEGATLKHRNEKDEEQKEKATILKLFNKKEKLYMRQPKGFKQESFVISLSNGWEFHDGRFSKDNDFFTINEIYEYRKKNA